MTLDQANRIATVARQAGFAVQVASTYPRRYYVTAHCADMGAFTVTDHGRLALGTRGSRAVTDTRDRLTGRGWPEATVAAAIAWLREVQP